MKSIIIFVIGIMLTVAFVINYSRSSSHAAPVFGILMIVAGFSITYFISFLLMGIGDGSNRWEATALLILSLLVIALVFYSLSFNQDMAAGSSGWLSIMALYGWIVGRIVARTKKRA